ncbi:hypothetical protein KY316_02495 [Candidatus Woesearchaeota archaeon]|nr:hypothetical protein [Candidatus Woesearchaeota archaeon]
MVSEEELKKKYLEKIEKQLEEERAAEQASEASITSEYKQFKTELFPKHLNLYEKGCNISEKLLKIKPDKKKELLYIEAINTTHLDITPSGIVSFSILFPLLFAVIFGLFGFIVPLLLAGEATYFFLILALSIALVLMLVFGKLPIFFARNWRLAASNQMVLCIFYVVTYMRHTSNLENAIEFASKHITGPLSLDLKKVLWDVETEKYESVKESLDFYLETWRKYNMEFVESFHLIESSLFEPSEARRLTILDKSLSVMLDQTYENMLHYAHNLKTPMTSLHMLGIVLPILGLVILPLALSVMEGVKWYYIAVLYDILIPVGVYFLGKNILSTRPTGYGDTDISDEVPELKKYKNVIFKFFGFEIKFNPLYFAITVGVVLLLIGFLPLMLKSSETPEADICIDASYNVFNPAAVTTANPPLAMACFLEYRKDGENVTGPFGLGAALLSVFVILGLGLPVGIYYKLRSKNIIKIRNDTKKLEEEFASGIFQLGNRMGDGLPAEIAFGKVAQVMTGTATGSFFQVVSQNITRLGMSVKEAIFNKKAGAIIEFPSKMIQSTMQVLIQASAKGPAIAAQALTSVGEYIKSIHRVNERLRDLMGDIISNMKSQIKFLTPVIAAVVVGISSMITYILGKLNIAEASGAAEGLGGIANLFGGQGVPAYQFQIIVGIYVIEIIYILTVLGNTLENGADKLAERYQLGQNMTKGLFIYCAITFVTLLLFNLLAGIVIGRTGIGLGGIG